MEGSMHLDRLRTFQKVVEHESFSRAAEELFLSQPAVSLQIRQLERELGVTLLERNGGRPSLTPAGSAVLAFAAAVEAARQQLKHDLAALGTNQPFVVFGCSPSSAKQYIPALAAQVAQIAPEVRISVITLPPDEAAVRLVKGELDFIMTTEPFLSPRIEAEPISTARIHLVAHPAHPLARLRRVTPAAVATYPFALLPHPWTAQARVHEWARNQDVEIKVAIELGSYDGLKQAVRNRLNLTVIAESSISEDVERGELVIIRAPGLPIEYPIYLAHRAGPLSPRAAAIKTAALRMRAATADNARL
jgi:DNA-binding transcriptional LysR family regulator